MILIFISVPNSFAESNKIQKLRRGVTNVFTAPLEIPKEIRAHWIAGSEKTPHILVWIFCGAVKGTVMTAARVGSGAWDIVTFPTGILENHEPLIEPDFVFDDWPQREEGVVYKNLSDL
ncbi:MAG: exosortase system-associated protein, TIGR04073 family [Candidatus Omnitrophica bacterium]|nr:exosortase system-associated protein, TIGR04073 family [Candidatus Omnitrophota bacterium]